MAAHEQKFTRAFNALLRELVTPEMLRTIERAIRANDSVDAAIAQIPYFDPDDPKTFAIWEGFALKIERVYTEVIDDAIQNENRKRGWKIPTLKAEEPVLPVNAGAAHFVKVKSLTRVVDMSAKEAARVRSILVAGLEAGAHVTGMVDEIAATVGLTEIQTARLARKVQEARDLGMSASQAKQFRVAEATKIRMQRARAISRTETNDALARGLQDSWRQASDAGLMQPGAKKQWAAMPYDEKRSSDVCQELDGQEVGINEMFTSSEGSFEGPPAHPNCRSTLLLIFPE